MLRRIYVVMRMCIKAEHVTMSIELLISLTPSERLGMLRSFIDSVLHIDPKLTQAAQIWAHGKTVAVECRIGDMPSRIHLSATPALLHRLAQAPRTVVGRR